MSARVAPGVPVVNASLIAKAPVGDLHFPYRFVLADNRLVADSSTLHDSSAILKRSFRRAFPPAVRGEGVYVWDATGKRYFDMTAYWQWRSDPANPTEQEVVHLYTA